MLFALFHFGRAAAVRAFPRSSNALRWSLAFTAITGAALGQTTTGPGGGRDPNVNPGDGPGTIINPGDGSVPTPGGGDTTRPPIDGNGGPVNIGPGDAPNTNPTIVVPRGALVGATVTATAVLPPLASGSNPHTYQWSVTGAQAVSSAKNSTFEFIADRVGTVTLRVTGGYNGTSYDVDATVTIISAATAGKITAPASIANGTTSATASVPPAQNADRTFRWTISGDAAITEGQNTANITFRPGSPGPKELTCSVNLQNLVTVALRSIVVVSGGGPPIPVTVNSGSGGGTYNGGSRVDLFAHAPTAGQVFNRWTGDTSVLAGNNAEVTSPHVVITVPARPVTLTATYKPAPVWSATTVAAFGGPGVGLSYFIPPDGRGLVFLLHDRGADASDWFNRPEAALLTRDLVAAGYGIAALNSSDRNANGTWATSATPETNADLRNHAAALDKFARENSLGAGKPIFFLGLGAGGNAGIQFAHSLATGTPARPVKGAVLLGATGSETLAVIGRFPQFFVLPTSDDPTTTLNLNTARSNAQLLIGRGLTAATVTHAQAPVYADRFRMLGVTSTNFTAADAQTVWTALKNADLLDTNSHVRGTPDLDDVEAALPAALRSRAVDVTAQLTLGRAGPELTSESDSRVIAFLDTCVANAPGPVPGRLINFSVSTKIAFLGDAFTLGFNLTGRERATLLIRGIGPGLTSFGVGTALAAPRLEVHRGSTLLATNDGWEQGAGRASINTAAAGVGAFALKPGNLDAAVLLPLEPGSHTVTLRGVNGTCGDALVEIYDVTRNATRITTLSALGKIQTAGDMLVPGIVISGVNPRTFIARALGPGLSELQLDTAAALSDPRIALLGSNGSPMRSNQNWNAGSGPALAAAFPIIGAVPLPASSSDAALVAALAPGNYTLQVGAAAPFPGPSASTASSTGTVLVELYEVP
jgi:hypothetical protein